MTLEPKTELAEIDYYMVGISQLPGWDQPAKLSSNESVLGMSPKAIEAARKALINAHLYPEVDTERLALALAKRYNLESARMAFGPGSDEILQRIVNLFAGPGHNLVHSKNAYMQFPIYAKLAGAKAVAAADRDFHYDVDSILEAIDGNTRVVLLANPDNPSGTYLSGREMRRLHAALEDNVLLIVDSAYEEFANAADFESATALVHEFDNVIVTRTFSKIYGMAGLRLGWCYTSAEIADMLTKIGPSFPVNTTAYAAGIAAVKDTSHVEKILTHNQYWIEQMTKHLTALGLKVYPSQTNFVLVEFSSDLGKTAEDANRYLNENGIIPRQFAVNDFSNKLRFTVGDNQGMSRTIELLSKFLTT